MHSYFTFQDYWHISAKQMMDLAIIQIILETDKRGRFILKPNRVVSHYSNAFTYRVSSNLK